jgi:hypothetical protein
MSDLVLGLDTFGDVPEDDSGVLVSYAEAIRQVVEEAALADELGLVYTSGSLPISARLRAVELYDTKVVPTVRDILTG